MARIRSVHPGQWTDGKFLKCSPLARLLALALRNEADDQGVFVWEPVDLKIRCLPNDNVDVEVLLAELVTHEQVRRYEVGGRQLGAIRNFGRFQRPKFPKAGFVITDEMRSYTLSTVPATEMGGDEVEPIPRNGEKGSLMERRGEENKKEPNGSSGVAPSARQPAQHLPADWKPDERQRDYAAKLGLNAADIEREAVKFRGYFADGKGADKRRNDRGWRQAWQNWIGTAAKSLPAAPRAAGGAVPKPGTPEWYDANPHLRPTL